MFENFLYSAYSSQKKYSYYPPGNLDVSAMIAHRPAWVAPTPAPAYEKKKLVLADWTARQWSPKKWRQVKDKLSELIDLGFVIFQWCDQRVTLLDRLTVFSENFDRALSQEKLAYTSDIIHATMMQHKLTFDEVQILDDYWINELLSERNIPGPRILYTSELSNLTTEEDWKNLVGNIKIAQPVLESIIYDAFSVGANQNAHRLTAVLPNISFKYDYKIVELSENILQDERQTFILNKIEWSRIKAITLHSISAEQIMTEIPGLKKIFLSDIEWNHDFTLMKNSLSALECLRLIGGNISTSNLQALLTAAPSLETITLSGCANLADTLTLEKNSLSALKNLDFHYSNISQSNLQAFLTAAPNLRTIDLSCCTNLQSIFTLDENSLPALETLNLSASDISQSNFQAFLAAAPNLRTIDLSYCTNIQDTFTLGKNNLSALECLHLRESNVSTSNLKAFLTAAPNLRIIDLSCCTNLQSIFTLGENSLPALETLNLRASDISQSNFQAFLAAAPNLRTIDLSCCTNFQGTFTLGENSLSALESLELGDSNISLLNLQAFLAAAPNLKTIDLLSCRTLEKSAFTLGTGSLSALENLELGNSNISLLNLQAFLAAAPNLKTINLSCCSNLTGLLTLKANSLPGLKKISPLSETPSVSKITGFLLNNLNCLKKAAPNWTFEIPDLTPKKMSNIPRPPEHNPPHDSNQMKEFIPTPKDQPFLFTFNNQINTKNQDMIIHKLSQYLTIMNQNIESIVRLQDGICVPLSQYFLEKDIATWEEFITEALAWNGKIKTLTSALQHHFTALYSRWQTACDLPSERYYIGNALPQVLQTNSPMILFNPWHAIAIRPTDSGSWLIYDPNYITGYQTIAKNSLEQHITRAIGSLVSITPSRIEYLLNIKDPGAFMAEGGLLVLLKSKNSQAIYDTIAQHEYRASALQGLLLRATSGMPAWLLGLEGSTLNIASFTQFLLSLFEQYCPDDAKTQLLRSMAVLTSEQKDRALAVLSACSLALLQSLATHIITEKKQAQYANVLRTWDKTIHKISSLGAYCQECLDSEYTKRLIQLASTQHVDTLGWQLQCYAENIQRPVFYVDTPEDLICASPWMSKGADNIGTLHPGPGGPLYRFLQENQANNPVLIINYERFNANDMVRFNSLLDNDPHVDGTRLPNNTRILGLINYNQPNVYQGSDFYSRFQRTERCPLTLEHWHALPPKTTVTVVSENMADAATIDLYRAPDWEDRLLGRWKLNGDQLQFIDGALIHALRTGKPIAIYHGFWGDPAFERWWQHARTRGVRHLDTYLKIPENITLVRPQSERYYWHLPSSISNGLLPGAAILNPTSLSNFFHAQVVEAGKLVTQKGWIERAKDNHACLEINVTRELTVDAWALLLDECYRWGVTVSLHVAPEVLLPEVFPHAKQPSSPQNFNLEDIVASTVDSIVMSTDMDTTVALLTSQLDTIVLHVSECTIADVWEKIEGRLDEDTLRFTFTQSDSALKVALAQKKQVILSGNFSSELLDGLAAIFQGRQNAETRQGRIILVMDTGVAGSFAQSCYMHQVSIVEKVSCLPQNTVILNQLHPHLESESLSKLKTRYFYLQAYPQSNSEDAWRGLESIPCSVTISYANSADFMRLRCEAVENALTAAPYVFLTGLSGVGKSTFVTQEFCTADQDTLYLTENNLVCWAQDNSAKRKILFIDEANLSARQWSEFEGLFNTPPSILVNGTLYILTEKHKVIFAGNPVNYGSERHCAAFFERHGQAVLFTPLSFAVIFDKMLKPIFKDTAINFDYIAHRIFLIYYFMCHCSTTEVLITPRELQMMALLTIQNVSSSSLDSLHIEIIDAISYALAKNLAPHHQRAAFDRQFQPKITVPPRIPVTLNFVLTSSRLAVAEKLQEMLRLRAWRRDSGKAKNAAQQAGGLGGIVIEGPPGIGKSELVIAVLCANQYTEVFELEHPVSGNNIFYKMPVSMAHAVKEKLLRKAFQEGAVVIIDEINSAPMMERLLNDLLMGQDPNAPPGTPQPGFMVMATQNPVTMAGRRATSTALQRRLITTELTEYSAEEIRDILHSKYIAPNDAEAMTMAYIANREFALAKKLSPAPTFRDLMHVVEQYQRPTVAQVFSSNLFKGSAQRASPPSTLFSKSGSTG